ncbi:hypothetical protein IW261DRAFT_1570661 [Armillaria novae-zelandiae]|uniref:Uncharacterized protein n=1 Tax=Armillaria novae-zelandiae TaxID=153914 RepID=A0AA39TXA0_9AGAR|nr:hypothetical protein IW261DRAFT_1570661 [Armillaria novae-zelandiae]
MSSLLATSDSGTRDVNRTALISGVTTAAVDLAALALGAIFICKCTQKRSISFMGTIKCIRVESKGAGPSRCPKTSLTIRLIKGIGIYPICLCVSRSSIIFKLLYRWAQPWCLWEYILCTGLAATP